MTVELLYFEGCPSYATLLTHLQEIIAREGVQSDVELRRIETDEDAQDARFLGSPSVRINGSDVEEAARDRRDFGLKCRLYQTPTGLTPEPPDDWITAAIHRRAHRP